MEKLLQNRLDLVWRLSFATYLVIDGYTNRNAHLTCPVSILHSSFFGGIWMFILSLRICDQQFYFVCALKRISYMCWLIFWVVNKLKKNDSILFFILFLLSLIYCTLSSSLMKQTAKYVCESIYYKKCIHFYYRKHNQIIYFPFFIFLFFPILIFSYLHLRYI